MPLRPLIRFLGGVLLLALASPPLSADTAGERETLRNWLQGPVRYITTKEEIEVFKSLESDVERRRFIEGFWRVRDPVLETEGNEFREEYRRRVEAANFLFRESSKPGWKTDRGRIYILLGPPDEIHEEPFALGQRGLIQWTYQSTESPYTKRNAVILFIEDPGGEYRLDQDLAPDPFLGTDISLSMDVFELQRRFTQPGAFREEMDPTSRVDRSAFRVHPDFYLAEDGNTFVTLTVGIRGNLLTNALKGRGEIRRPRVDILGRLQRRDGSGYQLAGERGFVASEENRHLEEDDFFLFQAGIALPPGSYTTYYGVQDWGSGELLTFRDSLDVPNFQSGEFSISTITLARKLEWVQDGSTEERKIPFVLGNLKVLPRPEELFRNGDEFAFYYQIYHAQRSPEENRVDVNAAYQFFQRPAGFPEAPYEAVGDPLVFPHLQEEVLGYSFPLREWPPADYRLRVTVQDNLSGARAEGEAHFRIR